jgi:hypothetical protein
MTRYDSRTGGIFDKARDTAVKEVGLLLLLTSPAWATALLIVLARK